MIRDPLHPEQQTRPARRGRVALLVLALLTYAAFGTFPFVWASPRLDNSAAWHEGALSLQQPGLATTAPVAPAWLEQVKQSDTLQVHLIARPSQLQEGPARLFSIARDRFVRNLEIGQAMDALSVRVRTTVTDDSGTPPIVIPHVFSAGQRCDLRLTLEPGRLQVFADGRVVASQVLPAHALRSWSREYSLNLGNDPTGNGAWLGEIEKAEVTVAGQSIDYADPQRTVLPRRLRSYYNAPRLLPGVPFEPRDFLVNLFGFVPFGALLAWSRPGRRRRCEVPAIVLLSLAIEVSQYWSPYRYPSINDLMLNTLGGVLGLWWFDRRRA